MSAGKDLPMVRLVRFGVRGLVCLFSGVVILGGYSFAGHHAIGAPAQLPQTWLDRAIPMIPATVWVYHSLIALIAAAWFFVPSMWLGRRLLVGIGLTTAICMLVFVYFPTGRYPTEISGGDAASRWALALLWKIDDPSNCLPSLHVALATCVALTMRELGLRGRWPMWWAAAIALSTLTTKQHYVIDVPTGALVGWAAYSAVKWAARRDRLPYWQLGTKPIRLPAARDQLHLDKLHTSLQQRAWTVEDLPPLAANAPLPPEMVRFLNQVIYVEHIAAINFDFLAKATHDDPKLRSMYEQFAADERRHANGLRRLLADNGAEIQPPGLGTALLLDQFDSLDPKSDADAMLVALSIPVFETFLDAGTIPFIRRHPAIASETLDTLIGNICRDESRHLAVNWAVSRAAVRAVRGRRLAGLRLYLNPVIIRSALATPFLAMDVYAHAKRLGFDFKKLMPSFRRLFQLHRGYPELTYFPLWLSFRVWVAIAAFATMMVVAVDRVAPRFLRWLARIVPAATDRVCGWFFSDRLLQRRGLPPCGPQVPVQHEQGGVTCREAA